MNKRDSMIVFLVSSMVFIFWMEAVALPYFLPLTYYSGGALLGEMKSKTIVKGQLINLMGRLIFTVNLFASLSYSDFLRSISGVNIDDFGCISKNGRLLNCKLKA